jgi:hypothetical protein
MQRRINVPMLAFAIALVGLTGFAFQTPLSPHTLQAQASCGAFDGKLCSDVCNSQCTNGSCCNWSHYYWSKQLPN